MPRHCPGAAAARRRPTCAGVQRWRGPAALPCAAATARTLPRHSAPPGRAAGLLADGMGQPPQQRVTFLVPIAVVVALEMVRIHEQQGQRRALAQRALPLALKHLVEQPPIGYARQAVGMRLRLQLALDLAAPRHFPAIQQHQRQHRRRQGDGDGYDQHRPAHPGLQHLVHGQRHGDHHGRAFHTVECIEATHAVWRQHADEGALPPDQELLEGRRHGKVVAQVAHGIRVARQHRAVVAEHGDDVALADRQARKAIAKIRQAQRAHDHAGEAAIGIGEPPAAPGRRRRAGGCGRGG